MSRPKKNDVQKRITVCLPKTLIDMLRQEAERLDVPLSQLVRAYCKQCLSEARG